MPVIRRKQLLLPLATNLHMHITTYVDTQYWYYTDRDYWRQSSTMQLYINRTCTDLSIYLFKILCTFYYLLLLFYLICWYNMNRCKPIKFQAFLILITLCREKCCIEVHQLWVWGICTNDAQAPTSSHREVKRMAASGRWKSTPTGIASRYRIPTCDLHGVLLETTTRVLARL